MPNIKMWTEYKSRGFFMISHVNRLCSSLSNPAVAPAKHVDAENWCRVKVYILTENDKHSIIKNEKAWSTNK